MAHTWQSYGSTSTASETGFIDMSQVPYSLQKLKISYHIETLEITVLFEELVAPKETASFCGMFVIFTTCHVPQFTGDQMKL